MKSNSSNFQTLVWVALTCVLTGGIVGAVTNMINSAVSPYYFKAIMQWDFENIWTAVVAQGIMEGIIYGVIFAAVFTTSFAMVTKGLAPYSFALPHLVKIMALVFLCWAIGGLLAMLLALLSPDFYKVNFPTTPEARDEMLKFAWVGGSIWGGMFGGLLSTILGALVLKSSWTKLLTKQQQ